MKACLGLRNCKEWVTNGKREGKERSQKKYSPLLPQLPSLSQTEKGSFKCQKFLILSFGLPIFHQNPTREMNSHCISKIWTKHKGLGLGVQVLSLNLTNEMFFSFFLHDHEIDKQIKWKVKYLNEVLQQKGRFPSVTSFLQYMAQDLLQKT